MNDSSEVTYYQQAGVQVTSSRLVVNQQVFPVRNIAAVKPMHKEPSRFGAYTALIVGILFSAGSMAPFNAGGVVFGATLAAFGVWLLRHRRTIHAIVITTSGTDVAAVQSTDLPHVKAVLAALNQAIIARG